MFTGQGEEGREGREKAAAEAGMAWGGLQERRAERAASVNPGRPGRAVGGRWCGKPRRSEPFPNRLPPSKEAVDGAGREQVWLWA